MQRIRDWMATNPEEAPKVRATNRSYVFFHVTGLSNEDEPVGAQGVPLTPGRSIAVDRRHEYGTLFFIEANLPIESMKPTSPFHRLMIAQDTGSAIVGPARADIYWGAGEDAGRTASRIRHRGRFVMLLPRELDLVEAGRHVPLPPAKPSALELAAANRGKGKVVTINSRENRRIEAGPHMPLPPAKPRAPELAANNRGKAKVVTINSAGDRRVAKGSIHHAAPTRPQPARSRPAT